MSGMRTIDEEARVTSQMGGQVGRKSTKLQFQGTQNKDTVQAEGSPSEKSYDSSDEEHDLKTGKTIMTKKSKISYNTIEGMEEIFKKNHEDRTTREKDFILRFLMKCVDFFKDV